MSDGCRQDERFPVGLSNLDSLSDDRRLEDLLAVARDYADRIAFQDGARRTNETWATLLDRDESFLLARVLTVPVGDIEREFLDDFDAGRRDCMAATVDWLSRFLAEWTTALDGYRLSLPTEANPGDLGQLLVAQTQAARISAMAMTDHDPNDPGSERSLRARFFVLTQQIRDLQQRARQQFPKSLNNQTHEPATGLLIALHRVHERIQSKLNRFPDRLADFFYHDCLGFEARAATPDKVHLVFKRDPNCLLDVIVPQGQIFQAAIRQGAEPARYAADSSLTVSDARVAALYSLRTERDPQISPECLFGQATRLTMSDLSSALGAVGESTAAAFPIFGGKQPGTLDCEFDAPVGLAIAAPILKLAQGERKIMIEFALQLDTAHRIERALVDADGPEAFANALGSFFVCWMMSDQFDDQQIERFASLARNAGTKGHGQGFLSAALGDLSRREIDGDENAGANADVILADELLSLMLESGDHSGSRLHGATLAQRRSVARNILFPKFFQIEVSTAAGWLPLRDALPYSRANTPGGSGMPIAVGNAAHGRFGLSMSLGQSDPAIVPCTELHGEDWPNDAPVLRLTLNRLSRIFGLSIFEQCRIEAVSIEVEVDGLREFEVHNQLGKIDPSKPFQPFGPMPDTSSYLIIDSPEIAAKDIAHYAVKFEWAGLPACGFAEHYSGYPVELTDSSFTIEPAVLRDGSWLRAGDPQPMFKMPVGASVQWQEIAIPPSSLNANWRRVSSPGHYGPGARNGFCKLQFASPEIGFGERQYATALAEALRSKPGRNSRQPRPPIAPRVTQLTLQYRARTLIRIGQEGSGEQVSHLHPLGRRIIHPLPSKRAVPSLLPQMGSDGQLLIGLDGAQVEGSLTLLFDLAPDTTIDFREADLPKPDLVWAWLSDDGWEPLDNWRVKHDTTMGFRRSGIVSLELPHKLPRVKSTSSGELAWLRVSTNAPSSRFAVLRSIATQALTATRVSSVPTSPLPPLTLDTRSASIPGVLAIAQPLPSFGLRSPETKNLERTRIGERLRHKNRASLPWDYERLVLDAFPQVHKVKCLAGITAWTRLEDEPGRRLPDSAGNVLVVVVPMSPEIVGFHNERDTRPLGIDACEIQEIRDYLRRHSSPFAHVDVIAAAFEQIQVRCHISLNHASNVGTVLQHVNQAIISFISPWADTGMGPDFDWSINGDDLYEAINTAHADIETVTGVSLIRVWEDDRHLAQEAIRRVETFVLDDNGTTPESDAGRGTSGKSNGRPGWEIRASRPWSLPLPLSRHIIQIVGGDQGSAALKTGIAASHAVGEHTDSVAGLQIGETFIIDS